MIRFLRLCHFLQQIDATIINNMFAEYEIQYFSAQTDST